MSEYALVQQGKITQLGMPHAARRLDTADWVLGLHDAPDDLKAACGYLPIKTTPRPAPSRPELIIERALEVFDGTPVETWTERAPTADEAATRTAEQNGSTLRAAAKAALATNAAYLAITTPSAAQVATQVRALTHQTSALTRLVLNELQIA